MEEDAPAISARVSGVGDVGREAVGTALDSARAAGG